jgi:site-specific recombinase XerD
MSHQNRAEIAVLESAAGSPDEHLSALARAALDAGMPANTRKAYERAWNEFTAWCQSTGRRPLPATSETLIEYVTYLCYERVPVTPHGAPIPGRVGLSPRSVSQAQWAIIKAHELADANLPRTRKAAQVIKGYKAYLANGKDPRARAQKATAADRDALLKLQEAVAGDGLIGVRDQVMFFFHMFLGLRISELIALNIEDVAILPQGLLVSIYRQKTRDFQDSPIPSKHAPVAVETTKKWIAELAVCGRSSGPLFVRVDRHGNIGAGAGRPGPGGPHGEAYGGRISLRRAEIRIHRAATLAGLDGRWSGHSFRRGFATEATRNGVDRLTIAHGGGWQPGSRTLDEYVAEVEIWETDLLEGMGI